MTTRSERIQTSDGAFDAHVAIPEVGGGPGMLLIHEIFGVNDYIEDAARRLAELGYVVLAPDLFWRTRPGLVLGHDDEGLQQGLAAMQELDVELAVQDAIVALAALRKLPEVVAAGGWAGALGFCLGGTLAYQVAAQADPDVAVCYYGSGIPGALDAADSITCPTLIHWGSADQYTPREQIDAVAAMASGREQIEFHLHEGAGHAFDNGFAPRFSDPDAAAAAWKLTSAFLERTLPAI
ncbi:MAG: carboxymethylenebutenolidase [bacterium]